MLVGITGGTGTRKTVIAKRLQAAHGFERLHAGQPVKTAVAEGFDLNARETTGKGKDRPTQKLGGATFRNATEAFGAGIHAIAPQATAAALSKRIMPLLVKGKSVAVDGVRSPTEAEAIRKMGGQIWRADNGKPVNQHQPMDKKQATVDHDAVIDTKSDDKKTIRANVDAQMLKCFGVGS